MKKLKKIGTYLLLSTIFLLVVLTLSYFAFVNFYPSFGGDVSDERKERYRSSKQFKDDGFVNAKDVPKEASFSETLSIARKFFFEKVENGRPDKDLTVLKMDATAVANYGKATRLIWFGHSAFLLQVDGKNILIDPMFGSVCAPHPWLGSERFYKELPLTIEQLPKIDAVVISHDHYDHLDYESIEQLKTKVDAYFVPLGVGVHLEAWGIESIKITEMDWWQETTFKNIQFACTPAQHFSGRKLNNGQSTLWASWVIKSDSSSLFFSGDSGYGPHFEQIGETYGPFNVAMMECGQYDKLWPDIHMFPEETAQAGIDVQATTLMPIHWGAFQLALHSWTDPIERVSKKAEALRIPLITPKIGEPVVIDDLQKPYDTWW